MTIDVAALFPGAADGVYLNTASMALGNQRGVDALRRAVDEWSRGTFDWPRAEDVGEDEGILQAWPQGLADAKVVDPPADVAFAGATELSPPRVVSTFLMKFPKRIDEAGSDDVVESLPFFRGEAVVLHVGLRVRQVDLRVRDVEIAAKDHRFFTLEVFHELEKGDVPFLRAVGEAG